MDKPKNLNELRKFYCEEYRPLYDMFMVEQRLPQELHFEISAAFDHMMRHDLTNEGDIAPEDLERMIGHLKRATYDSFKLIFENNIRKKFNRFMNKRYSDVEDGKFQPRICELFNRAKSIAIEARHKERSCDNTDFNTWGSPFEVWKQILPIAKEFTDLENSEKILRIDNPTIMWRIKSLGNKLLWSAIGAVMGWGLSKYF